MTVSTKPVTTSWTCPDTVTRGEIAGAERRRSTSRVTVAAGSRTACSRARTSTQAATRSTTPSAAPARSPTTSSAARTPSGSAPNGVQVGLQRLAASLLFGLKSSSWSRLDHGSPATAASSSVDRPSPRARPRSSPRAGRWCGRRRRQPAWRGRRAPRTCSRRDARVRVPVRRLPATDDEEARGSRRVLLDSVRLSRVPDLTWPSRRCGR
jgi:hypothetical protein